MIRLAAEKNYENKIKHYIEELGGWQVKFFANMMTKSGVPDILACVGGYFVAIEVKAQKGKPSELQLYQCAKIRKAGGFAFIAYPSGWEELKKILYKLSHGYFDSDMALILK